MKCDLCNGDKDVLGIQSKDSDCKQVWCLQCIKENIKDKSKYVVIPFHVAALIFDSMIAMSMLKSSIKNENGL